MTGLLFSFGLSLALELFFLAVSILQLPTTGTAKAMLGNVKQEEKAVRTIETYLMTMTVRLTKYIHMDEYKRSRMHNVLKTNGMNLTLGVYQAYAFVKTGTILLGVISCVFLLPLLSPVVIILSLFTYFRGSQKTDERLKAKRDEIKGELPRLAAIIEQELKTSRSIISILERFKGNVGTALIGGLDILLADMHSSDYKAALTRFEARLSSPMLSDMVWGLIGMLRGDDSSVYLQILAHSSRQLELRRLKAQTQKISPEIRVFSFAMLMCFLLTYLIITAYVTVTSLGGMFQERRKAMRLKEWVESHPQSSFSMMTPGGYVFLTPKQTKELLEGKDMKAHLGVSGYDITVSAGELLTQNVVNVRWNGAVYHILTDYMQKKEPRPPVPGQGVVMC